MHHRLPAVATLVVAATGCASVLGADFDHADRSDAPTDAGPGDAGVAASDGDGGATADGAPTYHELGDTGRWAAFDTRAVFATSGGFYGAAFDGRYVYFVPSSPTVPDPDGGPGATTLVASGIVLRFDTQQAFGAPSSWTTFDLSVFGGDARGFCGAVFDGRYVYFVPSTDLVKAVGLAARVDTQGSFTDASSWATFDTTGLDPRASGFAGGTFDGRFVYFVSADPQGPLARYDTRASFGDRSAWATFATSTVSPAAGGFRGALFDGRYAYFVPFDNGIGASNGQGTRDGVVARFDTTQPLGTLAAWSTFDTSTIDARAVGFFGGAFDGRYVYLAPRDDPSGSPAGFTARYDTRAGFAEPSAWRALDLTTINPHLRGFRAGAFDGRYVYYAPRDNRDDDALLARYDTAQPFEAHGAWSALDLTTIAPDARGFGASVFDGRYLYLAPYERSVVVRFDAKSPAAMPDLPAFRGSFF